MNEIVIEVRPGDVPNSLSPQKFYIEDNSRHSSIQSHRGSSRRRYPQNELSGAPTPQVLLWQRDCIASVIKGDLTAFTQLLQHPCNRFPKSVTHIRGYNVEIEDLKIIDPDDTIETLMWNPLHFAVYHNHIAIVKHILTSMEVNVGLTVHKSCAESEKDPTNNLEFQEDKIVLLLIALDRNNVEILSFLLNELAKFWTRKNFSDFISKLPPLIGRKGL